MKTVKLVLITFFIFVLFYFSCLAGEPPPGGIAIYGDSHYNNIVHEKIVDAIIKTKPKAVFHVGDILITSNPQLAWEELIQIISKLQAIAEYYPAVGNHDVDATKFWIHFALPNNGKWYSVEEEGIHFIVLDSNSRIDINSMQYKWLEDDLNSITDKNKFIIAIFHHPLFSTSIREEYEKGLKSVLIPLFEKYGVDIVFSGHAHNYERSRYNNIYYIVTGGGGGPLRVQITKSPYSEKFVSAYHFCLLTHVGNQVKVTAYDVDLNILDEFTVTKPKNPVAH